MCIIHTLFFFFFSSRRRHTRFDCDWSSDVCSSDLGKDKRIRVWDLATSKEVLTIQTPGSWATSLTFSPDGKMIASSSGSEITRSEEHTSELQSQSNLVCRLLLEKKKKQTMTTVLAV